MSTIPNPAQLKLELSVKGVRIDPTLRTVSDATGAALVRGANTRGVQLLLPEAVIASVPVDEETAGASPFLLSGQNGECTLQRNGDHVQVRVLPQPSFYDRTTSTGRPMSQVAGVYGSFVAINPAAACGYSLRGAPCRFCRVGTRVSQEDGFPMSVAEVVEVVRATFNEGVADFVYFNTGYFDPEDGGIEFLEPYIRAVKRHFDTFIAVQLHPPRTNRWIDRTYALGVDALSYSVEIHDPASLEKHCPGRARYLGRGRYYEALQYAAVIFPSGTIWSDLIVGLEPIESTRQGIDALTAIGVLPVLSLYRPLSGPQLRQVQLPEIDDLRSTFAHLYHACAMPRSTCDGCAT